MTKLTLPKVSLIIVVRNEMSYIEKSLYSLIKQCYGKQNFEIVLVDGLSNDGTRTFLEKEISRLKKLKYHIEVFDNPKLILASGWNIGIKEASGDIVCRIDAHSEIYPDYIAKGVETLIKMKDQNVVCVGGVLEHEGKSFIEKLIANLLSSKFAVGNSPYRTNKDFKSYLKKTSVTDTAVYGLYWKWIFEKIGYFDENLERNQDIELHNRILREGYKIVTNPSMRAKYYVRNSIKKLCKKAYQDGYWILELDQSRLRHKVPCLFVLYLFTLPFCFLIYLYILPLILYIFALLFYSVKDGKGINKFLLLFIFPLFHISYGFGTFIGSIKKILKKLSKKIS